MRRILIDRPQYRIVPEVEEFSGDAARKRRSPIDVDQPVIGRDAFQMRWTLDRHEPLHHRVVGLPDAADIAVGPRLRGDPFNGVVEVVLLDLVKETVFAAGPPGAAHIHVQERIAMVDVPRDRSGRAATRVGTRPGSLGRNKAAYSVSPSRIVMETIFVGSINS